MGSPFDIFVSVCSNYVPLFSALFPGWLRNSGANQIIVNTLPETPSDYLYRQRWHTNTMRRCQAMQEIVLDYTSKGKRIVAMDADCIILKNLSGGFHPTLPISVAHWPDFNMGVMFFNGQVDFDFPKLFSKVTPRIVATNTSLVTRPEQDWLIADEFIWREELKRYGKFVHKLNWFEWNYCGPPEDWPSVLPTIKDTVRVLHPKVRRGIRPGPRQALLDVFGITLS